MEDGDFGDFDEDVEDYAIPIPEEFEGLEEFVGGEEFPEEAEY